MQLWLKHKANYNVIKPFDLEYRVSCITYTPYTACPSAKSIYCTSMRYRPVGYGCGQVESRLLCPKPLPFSCKQGGKNLLSSIGSSSIVILFEGESLKYGDIYATAYKVSAWIITWIVILIAIDTHKINVIQKDIIWSSYRPTAGSNNLSAIGYSLNTTGINWILL